MDIVLIPPMNMSTGAQSSYTTNNGTHGEKIMACILALETKQCKNPGKTSLSVCRKKKGGGDPET